MAVSAFRTTYSGLTLHNTSSSLYNGGTLIAGQFAAGSNDDYTGAVTRDGVYTTFNMKSYNIPMTDDALTQMCPGAQAVDAKEGVFMPLRLLGPTQPFVSEVGSIGKVQQGSALGPQVVTVVSDATGANPSNTSMPSTFYPSRLGGGGPDTGQPWWVNNSLAIAGRIDDTNYDNVAIGIVIMRSLPYEASFSLQRYVGLEAVLDTMSPFRSMAMSTAPFDSAAMKAYYDIAATMPFSYPASYNSLALVLPYIAKALETLRPHVAPFLGGVLRRGAAMLDPQAAPARGEVITVVPPKAAKWQTVRVARKPLVSAKPKRQESRSKSAKPRKRRN